MQRLSVGLLLFSLGCLEATPKSLPDPTTTGSSAAAVPAPTNVAASPAKTDTASTGTDAAPALTVGSPAPALKVNRFLKGEPVAAFEPGKVYVVEFWATWCGPCITAMPHVTELQKRHPEVTFIGVNVWEDDDSAAEKFLQTQGDKIGYRIARDEIPAGAKATDGAMATTWLKAAEANGIPAAFVVDGQGRFANITHPMSLDASLPQIIAGNWDLAAAAQQHLAEKLHARRAVEFNQKLQTLMRAEPTDETLAALDQLATEDPRYAPTISRLKFQKLVASNDRTDQTLAEGRKLLNSSLSNNPVFLNEIAWNIVDPVRKQPASAELQAFALEAAKLADEKALRKSAAIADTLARALFVTGDAKAAAEAQRRSISLAESTPEFQAIVKELKQRLTEYEEAAVAAPAKPE